MTLLYCDLETFSPIDLKRCGTHAYAEQAEILLFPYALDDGEVKCWQPGYDPIPDELYAALLDASITTVWQNGGMFDLTVLSHAGALYDIPPLPHSRVFDTMACALAHSLPAGLGVLGDVLGVKEDKAKHKTGQKLIQLFCKPRPKNSELRRATRETHPVEWQQFIDYAKADVGAMREVYKKLPKWNYQPGGFEYDLWLLDQKINQRGVAVDIDLARGAVASADKAKVSLAKRANEMTNGDVNAATQRDALLKHIFEEYGIPLPNLQMATIERRLNDPDIPEPLKDLLKVRLQASTTSVSKYNTLLRAVSPDGRLRGLLQFSGAGRTGRWAGRIIQPQNLMRPTLKQPAIDLGVEVIKADACELFYDDVMEVVSNCVRGCFVAPPGRKLVVSDLANIEGRVAAWLTGEQWKLKAFREYDEGTGPDLYCVAYGKSFGVDPHTVEGRERQIGKVQELMLQYQGRVGAFVTGAATYRIDLDVMSAEVEKTVPIEVWEESQGFLDWTIKQKMPTYDLSDKVFIACNALTVLWREAHPMISSYWKELQNAYITAVEHPGTTITARMLKFRRDGAWLRIRLPSGRCLCYPSPKVEDGVCSYMGTNQYTKQWERQLTYGGKLFENICQGVARDVMAYAMPEVENHGFEIVLTVHDELITEAEDVDLFNVERLSAILSAGNSWTGDMPLAAAGFEAYRYRKE